MDKAQIEKMVSQVKKNMDKLIRVTDNLMKQVPKEHQDKITPLQMDIHSALRAAKSGDMEKINELSRKYADTNSK